MRKSSPDEQYLIRELKPYKGYGIDKFQVVNFFGKKIGFPFYNVSIEDDYIGEEYDTLKDAKRFIDSITKGN